MENINYISIVKQTWQERYDMYMKCTKEELARMMAERDRISNPDACTDGIYIDQKGHYYVPDNCQAQSPDFVPDNCVDSTYSYNEFVAETNPTGITFIG